MRDPVDASRLDNTHVRLAERMCDGKFPLTYLRDAVRHSIHTGILSAKPSARLGRSDAFPEMASEAPGPPRPPRASGSAHHDS